MSESDILGEVLRKTGPLTSVLDEVMAVAIADAEQDCARYPHEAYPFLRSFHVRARTRQLLEVQGPPQGWQRQMRLRASHPPLAGPCSCRASMAYSEQLGQ